MEVRHRNCVLVHHGFAEFDRNHDGGIVMLLELKIAIALGMVALLSSLSAVEQTESGKGTKADKTCTPETLAGGYVIVAGEKEGIKEPEERIKGTSVTFTKDSIVVVDKEKKEVFSAFYTLKTTNNPCDITMTSRVESSAGEIARGLIQKEGDTVRLIYALPTGEIPTGFKTKEKQLMFVLKKSQS
jgi:uncharacterized protein (TIGR03067 family)